MEKEMWTHSSIGPEFTF